VSEGQTVDVGTPIITVSVPDAAGPPAGADAAPPERQPVLVGYGVKPGSTSRRPRKRPATTRPGAYPGTPNAPGAGPPPPGAPDVESLLRMRSRAKPPVRRLARDLGVDLGGLPGSGPDGSVTRDDVQKAAADPARALPPSRGTIGAGGGATGRSVSPETGPGAGRPRPADLSPGGPELADQRIPVQGVRKHTAAAMVASAFSAPHVTEFLQVDVTETMAAVRRWRDLPEFAGLRVSPLLFVAKALLVAVRRNPMINSSWDEAAREIVVRRRVNLGIAVAAERGLLVPSVKGADALPLPGLARAIDELAAAARAGRATPADLTGGTITITNVGVFGVDAGTPILMPGEAAILAFGQVRDLPWVHQGELAVRKVTTLSLSFDHRIVDGELGSAVLRDVGSMLEDPVRMLAWS
jgi:2-oxoisovalerate dehydrogenase E2 component (dihydrolipoyl transacylase)